MIKGTEDYLNQIVKTHLCPEHGPKLFVAWHSGEDSHVIRCGDGHYPEEVTRELTPTQEFKAGKREAVSPTFSLIPKNDLGSGELLPPSMIEALEQYADRYRLDAHRGHVCLMYGKPYITIDGYLYFAGQTKVPYSFHSRPLTEEECKTYLVEEGSHAWVSEIIKGEWKQSFTGLGIVTKDEKEATSKKDKTQLKSPVVAAHPWQLAQKRAEWQALRRAFPIGQ